eukprot:4421351-Amphidinium_carterae.1
MATLERGLPSSSLGCRAIPHSDTVLKEAEQKLAHRLAHCLVESCKSTSAVSLLCSSLHSVSNNVKDHFVLPSSFLCGGVLAGTLPLSMHHAWAQAMSSLVLWLLGCSGYFCYARGSSWFQIAGREGSGPPHTLINLTIGSIVVLIAATYDKHWDDDVWGMGLLLLHCVHNHLCLLVRRVWHWEREFGGKGHAFHCTFLAPLVD